MIKANKIKIRIESLEEFFDRTEEELQAIEEGEQQTFKEETLSFQTLDQLRSFLTEKRLELLRTIRHKEPESIYELAKIVDRTPANVNTDVKLLENLGLVELEKTEDVREKVTPRVNYDKMTFEIAV